jgi:hypothetical protein
MADLLRVVDPVDGTYRRQMNRQLTVQESRHKPARDVCHSKCGTIRQAYRDGTEGQLGSLGLVLNAVMLCHLAGGRPLRSTSGLPGVYRPLSRTAYPGYVRDGS